MKKRITIVLIVMLFVAIFFIAGIPSLRYLKEHSSGNDFKLNIAPPKSESGKTVTLDISVEDICLDPISGEVEIECIGKDSCRKTCMTRGCDLFGLKFSDSEYKDSRCYCICFEENLMSRAFSNED